MYLNKVTAGHYRTGKPGLKVDDQLVAYATRFLALCLENNVWSHQRTLKAKVQCHFSNADHTNIQCTCTLTDKYKFKHRHNTTRHQIIKLHQFSFFSVCSVYHL